MTSMEISSIIGHGIIKGFLGICTIYVIAVLLINASYWVFGWGMDDSDKSSRERSGLMVLIDYKTGIEYLSDGKGGLIQRVKQ
jgi:hypothetical protein